MQEFLDYTVQDLENLVAAAPYSQYHQMLLALKKNELQKCTIYQPYLGSLPELKNLLNKKVTSIEPILFPEQKATTTEEVVSKESAVENGGKIEKKVQKEPKLKEKKKKAHKDKIEGKKNLDKKSKKKPKIRATDQAELSAFSKWLLGDKHFESQVKKQKSKKKSSNLKSAEKAQLKQPEVISEPLAQLLALQGHNQKAIEMYEKLIQLLPEKENIFLEEIEKLKQP